MNYIYIYLLVLLIAHIHANVINVNISKWDDLINYKPQNKDDEYIFLLDGTISANVDSGDFLSRFKKVTIKGNEKKYRIFCTSKDGTSLFHFSSETEELDFTLENVQFKVCDYSQVVMEGPKISVNIINVEFSQNKNSAIDATNVKSVTIKDSTFSNNNKGTRPQIYIENKKNFKTSVIIENTTGIKNTNEIKDVTSSGGWGYISNSNIYFNNVISDGNKSDYNGAVFNIRNCTGKIENSEFKNSIFGGKGLIYQYYSEIDINNTTFHDNQGYGCGIYYVYGTSSDSLDKYKPSNLNNCHFENNVGVDTQRAGAIYMEGAQTVNIKNSTFKNLFVKSRGGCFQVNNVSKITTTNCSFESIFAIDAGAIFNSGYDTTVEIKNCLFKDIYANTGAIVNANSGNRFIITDSIIEDSSSTYGLFNMIDYYTNTYALFNNVTFENNISNNGLLYVASNNLESTNFNLNITNSKFLNNGGEEKNFLFTDNIEIYIAYSAPIININDNGYSNVLIDNCEFTKNTVDKRNGVVSIQINRKGQTVLKNLKFEDNTVKNNGGGLYIGSNLNGYKSIYDIELNNIKFNRNHADKNGGGLYIDFSTNNHLNNHKKFEISDLEFNDNKADENGGGFYFKSNFMEFDIKDKNISFKNNASKDNKDYTYEKSNIINYSLPYCSSFANDNVCKIKNEENGEDQNLRDGSFCIYKNKIYKSISNNSENSCNPINDDEIDKNGFVKVDNYIYYCNENECTQMKSVNVLMEYAETTINYCDITGICVEFKPQNGNYLAISESNLTPKLHKIDVVDENKFKVEEINNPNDGYYIDLVSNDMVNQLIYCVNKSCDYVIPIDIYIPKNKLQGYFINGNKNSNPYIKCSINGCQEINIESTTCNTSNLGKLIKENDGYSLCFYYDSKVQSLALTSQNNGNYTISYYENNEFGINIDQIGTIQIGDDYVKIVDIEIPKLDDTSNSDSSSSNNIDDNNLNQSSDAFKIFPMLYTKTILIVNLILVVLYNIM